MKKKTGRRWAMLFLAALGVLASAPSPADGFVVGKVEYIRMHDPLWGPGWTSPNFWFSLTGVTSLGSCNAWAGRILFVGQSKETFTLVTIAQMTDKPIAVYYLDSQPVNGYCRAGYVTSGNPPPAF